MNMIGGEKVELVERHRRMRKKAFALGRGRL
jgi:hypothetical protein